MLKLAQIIQNYPVLSQNYDIALQDIKIHLILPRRIDITQPNFVFRFLIDNIIVNTQSDIVSFFCSLHINQDDPCQLIIDFDGKTGNSLDYRSDTQLSIYKSDTYLVGYVSDNMHNIPSDIFPLQIHPSCLVFQMKSPKLTVYNSDILSVACKYPNQYSKFHTPGHTLQIYKLRSGINTDIVQTQTSIAIYGQANQNKPSKWSDKIYWVDLPAKYGYSSTDTSSFIDLINRSNIGLQSVNGIQHELTVQNGPSITLIVQKPEQNTNPITIQLSPTTKNT